MIKAHFENAEQVEARAYHVYQYDWSQRLQVTGLESLDMPDHTEVHFAIEGEETAITRISTVSHGILVVDVPFKCLQFAKKITAYIYIVNKDAKGGQTIRQVTFTPHGRAKPDDDITPDEERTVDAILRDLNDLTKQANIDADAISKQAKEVKTMYDDLKATIDPEEIERQAAAVEEMYNNVTRNIDGGSATSTDVHNVDGGTAETKP